MGKGKDTAQMSGPSSGVPKMKEKPTPIERKGDNDSVEGERGKKRKTEVSKNGKKKMSDSMADVDDGKLNGRKRKRPLTSEELMEGEECSPKQNHETKYVSFLFH